MATRAKFKVSEITKFADVDGFDVVLKAVTTGSEENKSEILW